MPSAQPERLRSPRVVAAAHPLLAAHLAQHHTGFVDRTRPRSLLIPASATVGIVVKLRDSDHRPAAFVTGPRRTHLAPEGECAASYLEVRLRPLSGYRLLGVPLNAIGDGFVDLRDLLGPDGRRLAERLRDARTWRERFAIADRFVLERLDAGPRPAPEVARVLRRLAATGGTARIGELAREVGWSHKHLITRFTQQVGLPPKAVARLARFDRVLRALDRPGAPRWERIAAEAGYADQPHLVREFRTFTGLTPTAFGTPSSSWSAARG